MTDSTAAGFLDPASLPVADLDLALALQETVKGIVGIKGDLVRPRWQETPPRQPEQSEDWCAIGVIGSRIDGDVTLTHDGAAASGLGASDARADEIVDVLATFYGPNAASIATRFRIGVRINQNLEKLLPHGLKVVSCGDPVNAPELTGKVWRGRFDVTLRLRRRVSMTYAIRNIVSASGTIHRNMESDATSETDWNTQGA